MYIESILALQHLAQKQKPGCVLPLAIMTSDDTHQRTADLLSEHAHFGAEPSQITLLKQEKVGSCCNPSPDLSSSLLAPCVLGP